MRAGERWTLPTTGGPAGAQESGALLSLSDRAAFGPVRELARLRDTSPLELARAAVAEKRESVAPRLTVGWLPSKSTLLTLRRAGSAHPVTGGAVGNPALRGHGHR